MNIWSCKIGEVDDVPNGADSPMRDAVQKAYRELTGESPAFLFSGWGARLTESERAVVEDRNPKAADNGMVGAAEMLWVVLANVSGGDWTKQSPEWREAAARWRDHYFEVARDLSETA